MSVKLYALPLKQKYWKVQGATHKTVMYFHEQGPHTYVKEIAHREHIMKK